MLLTQYRRLFLEICAKLAMGCLLCCSEDAGAVFM